MILRMLVGLPVLLAAGCESAVPLTGGLAAANIGSVMVIGRTPVDAVVSVATGRDCSAVRLDRGLGYCAPEEAPPAPPPYCTRSLGRVDCWRQPPLAIPMQAGVAEGRTALTAAQEAQRTRRWPGLW
ncbi:hypothetical protein [Paracraurococcus lichenis]|uniref:Lipoprotein n=1 Tax=Paracraurococcus lichenis TaxID=3064888 RepID=A0ABT9DSW9_9PROT|nr:hypothetical protein [Paracraurococcus sp. LOR1-02]MDO9707004.1 hypothetical protein [Paracraurococcus sp. LOR1-02]